MIEKYIQAFNEIANPKINTAEQLIAWQGKAINIITRIYGTDSVQEDQIINIKYRTYPTLYVNGSMYGGGNNALGCQHQASEVISGLISDLTNFGLPVKKNAQEQNGINISINQHQNQSVEIKVILDIVKDELTGKQVKDIEEVLKTTDTPTTKKSKLIEKLKSFGSDVASNIVANILTNPNLYS